MARYHTQRSMADRLDSAATIRKFTGANPVTPSGNKAGDCECLPQVDMFEVSACVYRNDEYSQAHKVWYGRDTVADVSKHPSELGIQPVYEGFAEVSR
jgi:hypothetical protein